MKTGDFLKELATKVAKQNDPELVEYLSNGNHDYSDLPDSICNDFLTGLLSLESAKNNPKVKSHFQSQVKAEILNGIDAETKAIIDELGLQIEFDDKDNSNSKLRKVKAAVQDLLNKKPDLNVDLEKAKRELHQQNGELKQQIEALKIASEQKQKEIQEQANSQVLNFIKESALKGRKWAFKDQSEDINVHVAKILVDKALKKAGAKEINVDGNVELRLVEHPDLPYQDAKGFAVSYNDFVTRVLADEKFIAVNDEPVAKNLIPSYNGFPRQTYPAQQNTDPKNAAFLSEIDACLAGLKN